MAFKIVPSFLKTLATNAYGVLLSVVGVTPNTYLYTGEQWDADLGMYFLRARYLNPETGRFHTMDTFEGVRTDPQSLHKYLYAHANPVMYVDPSGNLSLFIKVALSVFALMLTTVTIVSHIDHNADLDRGAELSALQKAQINAVAVYVGGRDYVGLSETIKEYVEDGLFRVVRFEGSNLAYVEQNSFGNNTNKAIIYITKQAFRGPPSRLACTVVEEIYHSSIQSSGLPRVIFYNLYDKYNQSKMGDEFSYETDPMEIEAKEFATEATGYDCN